MGINKHDVKIAIINRSEVVKNICPFTLISKWEECYQREQDDINNMSLNERIDLADNTFLITNKLYEINEEPNFYLLSVIISYYFPMKYKPSQQFFLLDEGDYYFTEDKIINLIITIILKRKSCLSIYPEVLNILKTIN